MKKIITFVLIILLLLVSTASSSNLNILEKTTNEKEYWAVVVTIVDFELDVNDLNLPVDMMYTPLISAPNWNKDNVLFVNNENATKADILRSLDWLANQVDDNDIALFYYGGHGGRIDDKNGDEKDGIDECIATYERGGNITDDELNQKFDNITAEGLIVLFDCCLSAGLADSEKNSLIFMNSIKKNDFNLDMQNEIKGCGRVVIASTFEKAVALEVKGIGTLLTLSLKRIISKSKGDTNNDGVITAEETYIQLKKIFRRINIFTLTSIIIILKLIEVKYGKKLSQLILGTGIAALLLWETFSVIVYGGIMIPYYPIIYDEYEGDLPFLEIE